MAGSSLARLCPALARMVADARGVAAVEFGLIATTLLVMAVGAFDLTAAFVIQRDIKRVSVEIAQVMSSYGRDQDRMRATMMAINERKANVFVGFSGASLGIALITRKNGAIDVLPGIMTYLPADIEAQAKIALPDEGDCGVVNLITYTHKPMLLAMSKDWGMKIMDLRSYTVQLSYKDCKWV